MVTGAWAPLQVFFKMDKGGEGEEVRLADLPAAKELAFQGFGHELFQEVRRVHARPLPLACMSTPPAEGTAAAGCIPARLMPARRCCWAQMCVLAGCDFVGSLPGIGIKKAHQHLRRTRCFLKVRRCWLLRKAAPARCVLISRRRLA